MDIEILLDCDETPPDHHPVALQKFHDWFAKGAEIRYNTFPFKSLAPLAQPHRFLVDLGYADPTESLRTLHARLKPYGVKVFFHFS